MKLLIVDDHPVVRRGLIYFLEKQPGFIIIGEAGNGEEALQQIAENRPDLVLMDVSMPHMDGIEATKRIKEQDATIKVLILTSFAEQRYVLPAMEAGADGYQLKEIEPNQLVAAIEAVYKGSANLHPKVTPAIFGSRPVSLLHTLTKREEEVLAQIEKGKSNKEIAVVLHIAEQTVKTHVSHILEKLQVEDRTQAALYAVKCRMEGRS